MLYYHARLWRASERVHSFFIYVSFLVGLRTYQHPGIDLRTVLQAKLRFVEKKNA